MPGAPNLFSTPDGQLYLSWVEYVNIRDIAIVRKLAGQWTEPKVIFPDNWQIANEKPIVKAAFSEDAGATFGEAVQIDQGNPLGRVDVLLTTAGKAVISWMEAVGERAEIRAVEVNSNLKISEPAIIATDSAARSSGFPILARANEELYIAWTQVIVYRLTSKRPVLVGQ